MGSSRTSQAEITDLEIAIGVEEQVGRLEISMENVGRVHGLQGTKGLVDEVLAMVVGQVLCANNAVHIGLHKLLCEVRYLNSGYSRVTVG